MPVYYKNIVSLDYFYYFKVGGVPWTPWPQYFELINPLGTSSQFIIYWGQFNDIKKNEVTKNFSLSLNLLSIVNYHTT